MSTIKVQRAANCKRCQVSHEEASQYPGAICLLTPLVEGGIQEWMCGPCFFYAVTHPPEPGTKPTRSIFIDDKGSGPSVTPEGQ